MELKELIPPTFSSRLRMKMRAPAKRLISLSALMVFASFSPLAHAATPEPDWPCVQRKVEDISLGQMWPIPIEEGAALSEDGARLASILSLRRVSEEEAQAYVEEFVADHPDSAKAELGLVFDKVLQNINVERERIIGGIARYAEGQQARSKSIDELRVQMREEEAKDEPDFDKIDQMEVQLDWDERIHKDRERSLTYVCETPVILEKRAYSLAQMMLPFAQ